MEFQVPVAPTGEQRRIVAAIEEQFSRIDAGVEALQRARRKLQRMRAAVLQAAIEGRLVPQESDETGETLRRKVQEIQGRLGEGPGWAFAQPLEPWPIPVPKSWCVVNLGMVSIDGRYGTSTKCSYTGKGAPVLRIPNIRRYTVALEDLKYAVDSALNLSPLFVQAGDLLFIRTNGSRELIGRAAEVQEGLTNTAFASYLIRIRPQRALVSPRYLVYALSSPVMRRLLESKAATSAGQYNISLQALRRLPLPLPPLTEQHRIVQEVERQASILNSVEATIGDDLKQAMTVRRAILSHAFTGRLVPQDRFAEPVQISPDVISATRAARKPAAIPVRRRSRR